MLTPIDETAFDGGHPYPGSAGRPAAPVPAPNYRPAPPPQPPWPGQVVPAQPPAMAPPHPQPPPQYRPTQAPTVPPGYPAAPAASVPAVVPGYGPAPAPVPAAPPEHWRPEPVPGVAPQPQRWRPEPEWERVPPRQAPSRPGPARVPARQAAQPGPGQYGRYQRGKHERQGWARDVTSTGRIAALEDARLLLLPRRGRLPRLFPRLIFVALGYAAITSLAVAYAEAVPLPITASLVVFPAVATVVLTGMRNPVWGRRALVGWLSGILATIIYDCLRLALVKVGLWGDPIPTIGRLALNDPHANFVWGYVWRFLGNGGGMGMAFAMLPWRGIRWGVIYGTMICSGLFALLFFFPVAQTHFFPLTPLTAIGGMAGHWVYGAVLGGLTSWWLPPVRLQRVRGRLVAKLAHPGPVAGKRAAAQGAGR